jgi:hypothetical protein
MPKPSIPVPPRKELAAIAGINDRTVRYMENLSLAVADATMKTGDGPPNNAVEANSSRLYLDLASGVLYVNKSSEYGSKTDWQAV